MNREKLHVVLGAFGPSGEALVRELVARGHRTRAVGRSAPRKALAGVEVVTADITDPEDARRACAGASVVYGCVGAPYTRWRAEWPRLARGLIEGAASSGAGLVFLDNLYAYGPQDGTLVETMRPTTYGNKPAIRAQVAADLLRAHAEGRARVAIVRAADFYGPGVRTSALGEAVLAAAVANRTVLSLGPIDMPHTFTYMPDLAAALATVGESEAAWGEIWHAPNAAAASMREVVATLGEIVGHRLRGRALPGWLVRAAGVFSPMASELAEMRFQWDRPFIVSHEKFAARFPARVTPLADGLRAAVADWRSTGGR